MSNASRNDKRGDKGGDSDISGQRPAMQATEYAGLHSLGSEAFRVPLPPPLSEPPRFSPRVRLGLYVLGAVVGISAAAVGVALVLTSKPAPARDLRGSVVAEAESTGSEAAPSRAPLEAVAVAAPEPQAPEPVAAVEPPAKPAAEAPAAAEPVAEAAPAEPSAAPAPTASAAAEGKSASTRSRSTGSSRSRRAKDTGGLTAKLSREQVIGAMNRVQPAVMDCFHSAHGTAMANITVVGKTGRVTTAQVTGMSGTVGSCIARAVRGATFPRFTDETLTVRYPFAH